MNFPSNFPNRLKPGVHVAVLKAQRRFPKENQSIKRIKIGISAFAETAIDAVKKGEWDVASAYLGFESFLVSLCVDEAQRDHPVMLTNVFSSEVDRLKLAMTNSRKWINWLEKLDELARGENAATSKGVSIP